MSGEDAPEGVTPDGARYAAHLIRKRSKGDRFHPRRPETAAAMLAAAEWLDQFASPAPERPTVGGYPSSGRLASDLRRPLPTDIEPTS